MWPFGRSRRRTPSGPDTVARPAETAGGDEWVHVPPLQRTVASLGRIAEYEAFGAALSSWRAPALAMAPLGHDVSADAPGGVVSDIAAPTTESPTSAVPPKARRHAAAVAVQRSSMRAEPDLGLASRPGAGASTPAPTWRSVWSSGRSDDDVRPASDAPGAAVAGASAPSPPVQRTTGESRGRARERPAESDAQRGPMTTAPEPDLPVVHREPVQRVVEDARGASTDLDGASVDETNSNAGDLVEDEPLEAPSTAEAPIIGLSDKLSLAVPIQDSGDAGDPARSKASVPQPPARRLGLGPPLEPRVPAHPVQRAVAADGPMAERDAFSVAPRTDEIPIGSSGPSDELPVARVSAEESADSPRTTAPLVGERPIVAPESGASTSPEQAAIEPGLAPTSAGVPVDLPSAAFAHEAGSIPEPKESPYARDTVAPLASLRPLRTLVEPIAPPPLAASPASDSEPRVQRTAAGPVPVRRSAEVSTAARGLDARAFTTRAEVFLPSGHGPLDREPARSPLAHELVHVQQQAELGSWAPRESSPGGIALERQARAAELHVARLAESSVERGPLPLASAPAAEPETALLPLAAAVTAVSPPTSDDGSTTVIRFPGTVEPSMAGGTPVASEPVQRAAEVAEPAASGAPAASASGAPAPTAGGSTAPGDLDALAERLYPRLSFHLKQELRLDRERFGAAADVRG